MKLIPLTQGKFAQVDDEDYDFLMQWKWHLLKSHKHCYAARKAKTENGKRGVILMHRVVLKLTIKETNGDHIDRNTLNNQKLNLRVADLSQNGSNRTPKVNGTSKYLGVCRIKRKNGISVMWMAQIRKDNKNRYLGSFKTEEEAAKKYDEEAIKTHGEFANLNFK